MSKIKKLVAGIVARQNILRVAIDDIAADLVGGII
jgi:hypothetical protein